MVYRASLKDIGDGDPLCPVCLELIKATDKVRGLRDDLMHEGCDYTRPWPPSPLAPKKPPLPSI